MSREHRVRLQFLVCLLCLTHAALTIDISSLGPGDVFVVHGSGGFAGFAAMGLVIYALLLAPVYLVGRVPLLVVRLVVVLLGIGSAVLALMCGLIDFAVISHMRMPICPPSGDSVVYDSGPSCLQHPGTDLLHAVLIFALTVELIAVVRLLRRVRRHGAVGA